LLDLVKNQTNAYKRVSVPFIINIECVVHVAATLVAIHREEADYVCVICQILLNPLAFKF
jgi:hypothetical protein